jgi:uncharacterized protein YbjT (DUF2867 family)
VKHVVKLSVLGAETEGMTFAKWHRANEKKLEASGLAWTFLRCGNFMTSALMNAGSIREQGKIFLPTGEGKTAVIDPADIGAVAAAALTSSAHDGHTYRLTGPEAMRPAEQIARLSAGLGRAIPFVELPEAEAREELHQTMPAAYAEAFINFYLEGALDESPVLPAVAEVTGRAPRTFEEWIAAHREQFT